jgi:hypothetical protein
MKARLLISAAAIVLVPLIAGAVGAAAPGTRTERVQFAKGESSATLRGRLEGDAMVDYVVRAGAGQTLKVTLKETNPQNYFNVLPPGTEVAMFVGQTGEDYSGMLPADGDYTVRVYLMRPAARRNEASDYTLGIGVSGKALAPTAASKDALVAGTPYHASTTIPCVPYFESKPRDCEAFVIRRGFDGTATVEIPLQGSGMRRILFVQGKAVAADATEPVKSERKGDVDVVHIGADERYEIPQMLISGG